MDKKKPEIRFKGFEEEWVVYNASSIFETYYDKNHPHLPVLSASQELGMVIRESVGFLVQYNKENEAGYKRVLPGQFVIHLRSFQGGFAHSMVEGITSPAYTVMQFKKSSKQDDIYWKYVLTSKTFIKRLETVTYGIRDGRSISFEDFSELNFTFPTISEQEKIGLFLTTLDKLIAKLEAKLDKLRKLKQALLEKMFVNVNGGGKTPEIRFKGYTDKWEVKELREVLSESIIYGLNAKAITYDGTNKYLRITDIDDDTREFRQDNLTSPDIKEPAEVYKLTTNDIVLARTGATVGKSYLYEAKVGTTFFAGFLLRARVSEQYDANFVFSTTLTRQYKAFVRESSQRSSQPGINAREFSSYSFSLPCLSEQKQVGKALKNIGISIKTIDVKLTKLRNIKQSLLQKMFA